MTSVFVIFSRNPGVKQSLQEIVAPHWKQVIVLTETEDIDQLIESGFQIGGAALHLDLVAQKGLTVVKKIRAHMGTGPLIVYSANPYLETDEDALRVGASLIQSLPIRAEVLLSHFSIFAPKPREREPSNPPFQLSSNDLEKPALPSRSTLEIMRDCSALLACALDSNEMLHRFSSMLRDLVGISKIAVFIRKSHAGVSSEENMSHFPLEFVRGIAPSMANCVKLSASAGTPAWLAKNRKVLDVNSLEIPDEARGELELLGASTAFPLVSRGALFGVLFLGDRVAGKPLKDHELTLIYHLSEELSLALENAALHRESQIHAELMRQMLERTKSGTVMVDASLQVLQCNPAARYLLDIELSRDAVFATLPQWLQSRLFEQVKSPLDLGEKFVTASGRLVRVTCCSVPALGIQKVAGAMATIEDHTEIRRAKELAIQEQRFNITNTIAERLTHEISNSVTQLSTYEQLFDERIGEPEFQRELQTSIRTHTHRVTRLVSQLAYLTGTKESALSSDSVLKMLEDASASAQSFIKKSDAQISLTGKDMQIKCDRKALVYAFDEICINALQADVAEPALTITLKPSPDELLIEFSDNGPGFTSEASNRAKEAFYTTRNVGLGLGLSVATVIVERLGGFLNINHRTSANEPDVAIRIPLVNS
jgi:signal transduction histidine kinase